MKKIMKRIIIGIIVLAGMLLICGNVNAATITLDYNTTAKTEKSKNLKIYPGDDVYISISIQDNENEKVMAMYGVLEYDKEALELVPSKSSKEKGEISLNKGWSTGDIIIKDGKFMLYSTEESRDNTAAYIRFKAKEEINLDSTNIVAKDIVLYNNNYKEVSTKIDDVALEVKLHKNKRLTGGAVKAIIIIVILVGCVILIFIMIKKGKIVIRKVNNDETKTIDENINPIQTELKQTTKDASKKSENKNTKSKEKNDAKIEKKSTVKNTKKSEKKSNESGIKAVEKNKGKVTENKKAKKEDNKKETKKTVNSKQKKEEKK